MRRRLAQSGDIILTRRLSPNTARRGNGIGIGIGIGNGSGAGSPSGAISGAEAVRWARILLDQYGADADALAEIGIIEMLAAKNGALLVAWSKIFAAIQAIRIADSQRL
jgi:hypothetical protein